MVRDLPSDVVTLLFTDVEGSTRLLHELGDGYEEALHEHRRRLRAAFADHGGIEVDTQGDAFFVAFARASSAVAAAADGQRALAVGPIRVRMGLRTGEPRLTEEGYVGLDVHKGARIAAVGHGGQVLVSQTTRSLVDANVRDLGVHRLKDLSAPERIYQLDIEGLPCEFPLLKTIEAGMKNLPAPRASFVGRAAELDEIDRLLEDPDCRLLTLVGPGGAGKTRLALEAAARRIERYPHGVHFVPLVSVASPEFLAPAFAESIQFAADGAHAPFSVQEQLLDYLSERSTLLVLDNFEHLVNGAGLLGEIIERAPKVELLTTSRERLNVQSEWVLDVHGLSLTENGDGGSGALRLFVERSTQVMPGFSLDDDERVEARRICTLVESLPLGIELAASWVSVLCARRSRRRSSGASISSPRRCATSRSGIAASAPRTTSRGGCFPASSKMSSRGSRCSEATTDARRPSRSRAPTCACSPISCRSRSCDARTSAASSCTSCCASTRPSGWPRHPARRETHASGTLVTTRPC